MTDSTARPDPPHAAVTAADLGFLARFEDCSLPEAEWTHLAHIRVAWVCLQLDEADAALERIREGILRYNSEVLRRRHRYHDTVTIAFTRIIASRMEPGESWTAFAARIGDLLDQQSPVLLGYYSGERLFSDLARQRFVEPDLAVLPALCSGDD